MGMAMMGLDGVGEASGHDLVPMASDRCSTRAASSPVPIPYPIAGTSARRDPGAEKTVESEGAQRHG